MSLPILLENHGVTHLEKESKLRSALDNVGVYALRNIVIMHSINILADHFGNGSELSTIDMTSLALAAFSLAVSAFRFVIHNEQLSAHQSYLNDQESKPPAPVGLTVEERIALKRLAEIEAKKEKKSLKSKPPEPWVTQEHAAEYVYEEMGGKEQEARKREEESALNHRIAADKRAIDRERIAREARVIEEIAKEDVQIPPLVITIFHQSGNKRRK